MQTFLPYPNFLDSVKCLDYKRLGKQRVEAYQLLNIISEGKVSGAWVNHPACRMWRESPMSLALYMNYCIDEWIDRGYKNTMKKAYIDYNKLVAPIWLGDEPFHRSHQSNLLRKDPIFYGKYNWNVPNNLQYIWPVK